MAESPFYSDPQDTPVCPICNKRLVWAKKDAHLECKDHGKVDPLYSSKPEVLAEELYVEDNPFVRARKAWKVMGFANDRLGQTGTLAEVFMAYQKLDETLSTNIAKAKCDHVWVNGRYVYENQQDTIDRVGSWDKICVKCHAAKLSYIK